MARQILIVDGNVRFRNALAATLQQQGFDTAVAENGTEALEHLRHWGCDLVILDIELPAALGLSFLGQMRAEAQLRCLPVIVVTGLVDKGCAVRAASLGVRDYLFKRGLSSRVLVERVKRLVGTGDSPGAQWHCAEQRNELALTQPVAAEA